MFWGGLRVSEALAIKGTDICDGQLAVKRLKKSKATLHTLKITSDVLFDQSPHGIVAQTVGVVGIFVAGDNLINALPQQPQRIMMQAVVLSWIAEASGPVTSQMMALIEGSQRQQTGVAGNLATGKIGANRLMTVEGEVQLW